MLFDLLDGMSEAEIAGSSIIACTVIIVIFIVLEYLTHRLSKKDRNQ